MTHIVLEAWQEARLRALKFLICGKIPPERLLLIHAAVLLERAIVKFELCKIESDGLDRAGLVFRGLGHVCRSLVFSRAGGRPKLHRRGA